jgi:hypothetical protein
MTSLFDGIDENMADKNTISHDSVKNSFIEPRTVEYRALSEDVFMEFYREVLFGTHRSPKKNKKGQYIEERLEPKNIKDPLTRAVVGMTAVEKLSKGKRFFSPLYPEHAKKLAYESKTLGLYLVIFLVL